MKEGRLNARQPSARLLTRENNPSPEERHGAKHAVEV